MLEVGEWALEVGEWVLEVGEWVLEVGEWVLGVGEWVLVGKWMAVLLGGSRRAAAAAAPRVDWVVQSSLSSTVVYEWSSLGDELMTIIQSSLTSLCFLFLLRFLFSSYKTDVSLPSLSCK